MCEVWWFATLFLDRQGAKIAKDAKKNMESYAESAWSLLPTFLFLGVLCDLGALAVKMPRAGLRFNATSA